MELESFVKGFLNVFTNLGFFASWLFSEIDGLPEPINTPIAIITGAGFVAVIALWIFKLVNPLS